MNRPSGFYKTVSVLRSWTAVDPAGAIALVLDTKEMGAIAFRVDEQTLPLLQNELNAIGLMLSQHKGNA